MSYERITVKGEDGKVKTIRSQEQTIFRLHRLEQLFDAREKVRSNGRKVICAREMMQTQPGMKDWFEECEARAINNTRRSVESYMKMLQELEGATEPQKEAKKHRENQG